MGVFRQSGRKTYMMRVQQNGQQVVCSTGETVYEKALDVFHEKQSAARRGEDASPKSNKVKWEQAVEDLRTDYVNSKNDSWDDTERRLALHLTPFFRGMRMAAIKRPLIERYKAQRATETYVPGTRVDPRAGRTIEGRGKPRHYSDGQISRELEVLKRMFNLQVELGQLTVLPPRIKMVGDPKLAVRKGFLTADQIEELIAHLPNPIDKIVRLTFLTGWRVASEILTLEWSQVNLADNELRIWKGGDKSGDGRVVYLTDEMRAIFVELDIERRANLTRGIITPFVFVRIKRRGRGGAEYAARVMAITKPWNKARTATGYLGQIPHNLRRSAARIMDRRGVPRPVAKAIIGHKTDSMYERYNIVAHDDLQRAAAQLSGQFTAPPPPPSARKRGGKTATAFATAFRPTQAHSGGRRMQKAQ